MRISTRGHYAVQALVDMAGQAESTPTSLSVIAERQDLSLNYLEQLFVKLRKAKLVGSVRGPGGGYLLAKPASEITISEVFAAVDEGLIITGCADEESHDGRQCSKVHECQTQTLWSKLCQHFNELLHSITIDDVVKGTIDLPRARDPSGAYQSIL